MAKLCVFAALSLVDDIGMHISEGIDGGALAWINPRILAATIAASRHLLEHLLMMHPGPWRGWGHAAASDASPSLVQRDDADLHHALALRDLNLLVEHLVWMWLAVLQQRRQVLRAARRLHRRHIVLEVREGLIRTARRTLPCLRNILAVDANNERVTAANT